MTLITISVVCCSKPVRPNALLIISSLISLIEDSEILFFPLESHIKATLEVMRPTACA